jgi:hypothetical protein
MKHYTMKTKCEQFMRTSRVFAIAAAGLFVGFLAARLCGARPSESQGIKEPAGYDFGALRQFESFVSYLQDTQQTNILQRFNGYLSASLASRHHADLGVTLAILMRLRDGRTNEAYELLEGRLDTDIVGFVASYRELPASAREQPGLKLLAQVKDYRDRYPFKHRYREVDEGVAAAMKILDGK